MGGLVASRFTFVVGKCHAVGRDCTTNRAADHATNPIVRNFASKMALSQGAEISVMTQMLAERGAQPLPAN